MNGSRIYEEDRFPGTIYREIHGLFYPDTQKREHIKRFILRLKLDEGQTLYGTKLWVTRAHLRGFLSLAHNSKLLGYFASARTFQNLSENYWRFKDRDVKYFSCDCVACQKSKNGNRTSFTKRQLLKELKRRLDSLPSDFIVSLPAQRKICCNTRLDKQNTSSTELHSV